MLIDRSKFRLALLVAAVAVAGCKSKQTQPVQPVSPPDYSYHPPQSTASVPYVPAPAPAPGPRLLPGGPTQPLATPPYGSSVPLPPPAPPAEEGPMLPGPGPLDRTRYLQEAPVEEESYFPSRLKSRREDPAAEPRRLLGGETPAAEEQAPNRWQRFWRNVTQPATKLWRR